MQTVHTFGDSHASREFGGWDHVEIPGHEVETHWIGARLMHSFARDGLSMLNILDYRVLPGDTVVFSFGEIDVRRHLANHSTTQESIDQMVSDYLGVVAQNTVQIPRLRVVIYCVLPPSRTQPGDVRAGTDEQRLKYTRAVNASLRWQTAVLGWGFLDVTPDYSDQQGFMNLQHSDDSIHIKNGGPLSKRLNFLMARLTSPHAATGAP